MTKIARGVRVPVLGEVKVGQPIETLVPKGLEPKEVTPFHDGSKASTYQLGDRRELTVTEGADRTSVRFNFHTRNPTLVRALFHKMFGLTNSTMSAQAGADGIINEVGLRLPGSRAENKNGREVRYSIGIEPGKATTTRTDRPSSIAYAAVVSKETTYEQTDSNGDGTVDRTDGTPFPKSTVQGDWLTY